MDPRHLSGKNNTTTVKQKGVVQMGKLLMQRTYSADFAILHKAAPAKGK